MQSTKISKFMRKFCVITALMGGTEALADPSFNCSKADTPDETAICGDKTLSRLDVEIAETFKKFDAEFVSKKEVARRLLHDRRLCKGDKVCIAAAQLSAFETFGGRGPWVRNFVVSEISKKASSIGQPSKSGEKAPQMLGECNKTHIAEVTTRFGEALTYENSDEGTAVKYKNGVYGVTYERDSELSDAKAGDELIVCLLTKRYDCPEGDSRGSEYYALDLRTLGEWILPDAQHMCGGA